MYIFLQDINWLIALNEHVIVHPQKAVLVTAGAFGVSPLIQHA
jgi:hypothetical protein